MRKLLLSLFTAAIALNASAQYNVATFDTITLSQADTYLISYASPGQDIGFNDGGAHFYCVYDTIFGGIWDHGFAYSNVHDSVTSGIPNQYAVKALKGYNNSDQYAVIWCSQYATSPTRLYFTPTVPDTVLGFYICNSTFAYNSMRDGDAFAKKFGGITGNDADWFLLTIKGYANGTLTSDSVNFYLADFRSANNLNDYIVDSWAWVDLTSLGKVDSLEFKMNSSDTSGGYANTPTYFCMDNLASKTNPIHVNQVAGNDLAAKMYPNPAVNELNIELADNHVKTVIVYDAAGKLVMQVQVDSKLVKLNTATLPVGTYFLQLKGDNKSASARFIKQ